MRLSSSSLPPSAADVPSIAVYQKKRLREGELIGVALMDLHTVACGPTHHSMLLLHPSSGEPVGRIEFDLKMKHVREVAIAFPAITARLENAGEVESIGMPYSSPLRAMELRGNAC